MEKRLEEEVAVVVVHWHFDPPVPGASSTMLSRSLRSTPSSKASSEMRDLWRFFFPFRRLS